jgi:hypothetical protein
MGNFFARSHERKLVRAGLMYQRGRTRTLWLNGVLYFGGSLFLLYNVIDYFFEPAARATRSQLSWFCAVLVLCILAGYIHGVFIWRQLERTFSDR